MLLTACVFAVLAVICTADPTPQDQADITHIEAISSETSLRRTNVVWPVISEKAERDKRLRADNSSEVRKKRDVQEDSGKQQKYIRGCYFTNWAQYRPGKGKYTAAKYESGICTHILYAFGWMNNDFTMRAYDPTDERMWNGDVGQYEQVTTLRKLNPELKVLLSIGGWTFGTKLFKAMAATREGRAKFIDSATKFVRKWKFDGLDIDWEYPVGDKEIFTALIQELRAAFEEEAADNDRERLLLSAAVSAAEGTAREAYDIPAIAPLFDFILLMAYDFHGAWEMETGMNAPLYKRADETGKFAKWNLDSASAFWAESGMPKHKIVVGMAMYGRGWTLQDKNMNGLLAPATGPAKKTKYTREAGVASYYELCQMLETGAVRSYDVEHQQPYLVKGNQWFSYDDEESLTAKMRWLKQKEYGGAFVWTLDFDDFDMICGSSKRRYPLLSVIRDELEGEYLNVIDSPMPQPPSPKPSLEENACRLSTDGFHVHPSNCQMFVLCLDQKQHDMHCPGRLHYSPRMGYCVEPELSPCETQGGRDKEEPETNSKLDKLKPPHLREVHMEAHSTSGTSPPTSPVLSPPTRTTHPTPSSSLSVESVITLPATLSATSPRPLVVDCSSDGFFPDADCSKFVRCVSGMRHVFSCPPTLVFNTETKACDYAGTANPCV